MHSISALLNLMALGMLAVCTRALELRVSRIHQRRRVVLVVDDALDNQMLIGAILKKTGAQVETAANGEEGVEKALSVQPDVIIMDVQMPKMDGFEATSKLRRLGFQKPIISCTARRLGNEENMALTCGANAHLAKPVERTQLLGLLGNLLSFA